MKINEQSLQEIRDYEKRPNLRLIGVLEDDRENESKLESTLQDIIQENYLDLARQANIQMQEIHTNHQGWNEGKNAKGNQKERLGHPQREAHETYSRSLSRNPANQKRVWANIIKEKNFQPRIPYPAKLSFISEGEIKSFMDKHLLRDFIATRSALQELLKKALNMERNNQYQPLQKRTKW